MGRRVVFAVVAGTSAVTALAVLAGMGGATIAVVAMAGTLVLTAWSAAPKGRPGLALAWIAVSLAVLFAVSGSADPIEGDLQSWYSGLPFPFAREVSVEQFVLGLAGALFLLATANRIVRLVLEAAGTSPQTGESALRGGRLLGPMERLMVSAIIVAGDPAGAALVIAAKSLLRFPEIRSDPGQPDQITEYFLIGTFVSLLLAGSVGVLILASG